MKKNNLILLVLVLIFGFKYTSAQVPQKFNYQGIARDSKGQPMSNQRLSLKLIVLPTIDAQNAEYEEVQQVQTNEFGLYTLQIGNGTALLGEMKSVKWETGNKYIKVMIDPSGGEQYQDAGTTQLLSVPYAIYADKAGVAKSTGGGNRAGNQHYLSKFDVSGSSSSEINSQLYDNGTSIGIGTTTPQASSRLHMVTQTGNIEHIRMENKSSTGFGKFMLFNDVANNYATFTKYGSTFPGGYLGVEGIFPYANMLAFGNNGGPFMLANTGNVGIGLFRNGTTQLKLFAHQQSGYLSLGGNAIPTARVHFNSPNTSDTIKFTNSSTGHLLADGTEIRTSGTNTRIINREAGYLLFGTNNQDRLAIDGNGKVGIGTVTPSQKLTVAGNVNVTDSLSIGATTPSNNLTVNGKSNFTNNVAIGTTSVATTKLSIYGDANTTGSLGVGMSSAESTAILQANSGTKGFLKPRMTTTQRDAIVNPAIGLEIYNLDDNCTDAYNGTTWLKTCGMIKTVTMVDSSHPIPNSWVQRANPSLGRIYGVGFSIGNKGYIGAGSKDGYTPPINTYLWEYDLATDAWAQKAGIPIEPNRTGAVGFSINGKGYIGLGNGLYGNGLNDMWEYDPISNTFTQKANFPPGARAFASCFTIQNKAYIGTGKNGTTVYKDFWEYDPILDVWTQKADFMGLARHSAVGFSVGGKGYIGTGDNDTSGNFSNFYAYTPQTNTWSQIADMPDDRHGAVAFTIGNMGYVGTGRYTWGNQYSGQCGYCTTGDLFAYNPISDTWSTKTPIPYPPAPNRAYGIAFSIGNKGFVCNGSSYPGQQAFDRNDLWEYMDDNTIESSYTTALNTTTNSVSDGAWTVYNNKVYSSVTGNVGIGTSTPAEKLTVFNGSTTGTYTTSGWMHSSDARLKTNILPLENSLSKLLKLRGVQYNWKSSPTSNKQLGFIAQDVEKIYPEVVSKDADGNYSMSYQNLIAPLLEAIREQQIQIDELKKKIETLEKKVK